MTEPEDPLVSLARTMSRRRVLRSVAVVALVGASVSAIAPSIVGAGGAEFRPSGEPCEPVAVGVFWAIPPDAPFNGSGVLDFSTPCQFTLYYGPPSVGSFTGFPDGSFTYTP